MTELCIHNRLTTSFCEPCAEDEIMGRLPDKDVDAYIERLNDHWRGPSGLNASYYDFPSDIHSAQDLIEWLDLNFANGNILKSLVREYGPETKGTTEIYEAEKRYFFAKRHLENMRYLDKERQLMERPSTRSVPRTEKSGECSADDVKRKLA